MADNGAPKRKEGGDKGGGRDKKKAKYIGKQSGSSGAALPHTSQGVLVTCESNWEDRAANEVTQLIEEHYEKVSKAKPAPAPAAAEAPAAGGEDKPSTSGKGEAAAEGAAAADGEKAKSKDISELLAAEVAELKDKTKQRFKRHHTGIGGCVYILFPADAAGPGPVEVVTSILSEAKATKQLRARHAIRLLPITHVCYAGIEEMKALGAKVVEGQFPEPAEGQPGIQFAAEYEHRSAEGFDRMEVINAFVNHVKCPPHKVNLKAPQKTILVQLLKNVCAASVVNDYRGMARFNIKKLTEEEEEEEKK